MSSKLHSNQSVTSGIESELIVIKTEKENIVTVKEMYHDIIKEQLVLGVSVEAPNGDWYQKEQNFDVENWVKLSGSHITMWPKNSSDGKELDISNREFYKKIPEIWLIPLRRNKNAE